MFSQSGGYLSAIRVGARKSTQLCIKYLFCLFFKVGNFIFNNYYGNMKAAKSSA